MDCSEFLSLAKRLKDEKNAKESEFRTSISRTYAYAYVLLKERYKDDKRTKFENKFGDKWALGQLFFNAGKRHLWNQFRIYSKDRNDTEYDMEKEFNKNDADEYIIDIEQFIDEVKEEIKVEKDT
jgi:hypothetical protein